MSVNIDVKNFACPDCGANNMDSKFLDRLSTIQFGMRGTLVITSGYRCPAHNAAVGGSPTSQHLQGLAADIACNDANKRMLIVSLAVRSNLTGIGVAKSFVHLDLRPGMPVLWTYPLSLGQTA